MPVRRAPAKSKPRPKKKVQSSVVVSRRRKGVESQVRSASGGTRGRNEAVGSRLARAKKLRPAAKAHAFEKINQEVDKVIEKKLPTPKGRVNRRTARASHAAARTISRGIRAGTRRTIKGTNTGTGPKSVGVSAVRNRNKAAKKRKAQAKSASRSTRK